MNDEREDELDRDDARFIERLRTHYAPPPQSPAQRAAFDTRLRSRLERRRWPVAWVPALAAAALAALWLWSGPAQRDQEPAEIAAANPASDGWEQTLFDDELIAARGGDSDEELPPEYAAIEGLFLDGV